MNHYCKFKISQDGADIIYPFDTDLIFEIKYNNNFTECVAKVAMAIEIEGVDEITEEEFLSTFNYESVPQEPPQPTEIEMLGEEIVKLKLSNIQKDNTINVLGQELANIKLKMLGGM